VFRWYYVRAGAKRALIARGSGRSAGAGRDRIRVRLTARGRRLLRRAGRLRLVGTGAFTAGSSVVTATRRFTLKR
jgi:hypothetical protein